MPADSGARWALVGFEERLDTWISIEAPFDDLRLTVTAWMLTRFDDPYQGVRRAHGFDNLWFGVIPDTAHDDDRVVCCSYWIEETTRTVRCDSIATLSWPV